MAYLSIKELLYTRQALLPVYTQSGLIAVYWIFRDGKDDRWDVIVVKERIDDGHLLCSGPYDSYRSRAATETVINMERVYEVG